MKFLKEHKFSILVCLLVVVALCWRFIPTPLYSFLDIPVHDVDSISLGAIGFRWGENSREIPLNRKLETEEEARIKEILDLFSDAKLTRDFRSLIPFRISRVSNAQRIVTVFYSFDDHHQGDMFQVLSDGMVWYGNQKIAHLSDKTLCDRLIAYLDVNGTEGQVDYRYDDSTYDTVIDSSIPPIADK